MKDVMRLTGAGQIGMTIARRMGGNKKIIVAEEPASTPSLQELLSPPWQ